MRLNQTGGGGATPDLAVKRDALGPIGADAHALYEGVRRDTETVRVSNYEAAAALTAAQFTCGAQPGIHPQGREGVRRRCRRAKGIHQLLLDGYTAFKKARDALQAIVDGAEQAGIVVDSQGLVTARYPVSADTATRHDPDTDQARAEEKAGLDAWTERIRAIVAGCTADDESLRLALPANVGDSHDFTAPIYTSLDAEEAQRAYELATKGAKGEGLTYAELQQLNQLLAANQSSVEFTTSFYEKLGPKGTLNLFAQISTDTYTTAGPKEEQLKDVQDLQRNLGLTLATATDPDSRILIPGGNGVPVNPLGGWSAEFRKLGAQKLSLFPGDTMGVYGPGARPVRDQDRRGGAGAARPRVREVSRREEGEHRGPDPPGHQGRLSGR